MHALFFFFFASPWNPIPTFLPVLIYNCSSTTSSLFIFISFNIFLLCNLQYYLCASCGLFVIFFSFHGFYGISLYFFPAFATFLSSFYSFLRSFYHWCPITLFSHSFSLSFFVSVLFLYLFYLFCPLYDI